jgi:transposase
MCTERSRLVAERTRISNRINGELLRYGHTVGQVDSVRGKKVRAAIEDYVAGRITPEYAAYFSDLGIPAPVWAVCQTRYQRIDCITEQIKKLEKELQNVVESMEWTVKGGELVSGKGLLSHLLTVPGVGENGASVWLSEVGDICRFPSAKALGAFCGLDPSVMVSADKVTRAQTRGGNKRLQYMLKNAARAHLLSGTGRLVQWALAYAGRHVKGGRAKSIRALARKLCHALYYVHTG